MFLPACSVQKRRVASPSPPTPQFVFLPHIFVFVSGGGLRRPLPCCPCPIASERPASKTGFSRGARHHLLLCCRSLSSGCACRHPRHLSIIIIIIIMHNLAAVWLAMQPCSRTTIPGCWSLFRSVVDSAHASAFDFWVSNFSAPTGALRPYASFKYFLWQTSCIQCCVQFWWHKVRLDCSSACKPSSYLAKKRAQPLGSCANLDLSIWDSVAWSDSLCQSWHSRQWHSLLACSMHEGKLALDRRCLWVVPCALVVVFVVGVSQVRFDKPMTSKRSWYWTRVCWTHVPGSFILYCPRCHDVILW